MKHWHKTDISAERVKDLAARYDCDHLTASILLRRGIEDGETIRYFLEDDPRHLRNPFEIPGMEDAVERILAAKEEGERVLVFGDRDVDGITATALLAGFLKDEAGMDVTWRVPTGDDRYGLSIEAVETFAAAYGTLIITVDCGISCLQEIRRARELSVDVIITDHHNPQEEVPDALAIVNPKIAPADGSAAPFPSLAGCGVAYKLAAALRFALRSQFYGQPVCLLNTRPVNDAWVVEIAKIRNLAVVDTLTETVVPGMVRIGDTRLPRFLESQQILVWDAALQKRALREMFGNGVEIGMLDIAPEIAREVPQTAGKSLLRIKELSRIARYQAGEPGELDVFVNLFTSFVQRREGLFTAADEADLQLAALGTLADIMPLKDENRVIVRQGLKSLSEKPRAGLANLLGLLFKDSRRLSARDISWVVSPAINAAGRMGRPEKAAALLLETDGRVRDSLAAELMAMNEERKKLGADTWLVVEPLAASALADFSGRLAVAAGENIPRGVTGIMANKLTERFKVPAIVASVTRTGGGGSVVASLRSCGGYDLRFLLETNADLFIDWGGHDYAAGFSMDIGNWEEFLARMRRASAGIELAAPDDGETLVIDAELPPKYLTPDITRLVDRFEPYGEGNEPLTFLTRGLRVADLSLMGKTEARHVKLSLDAGRHKWPAVYWQAADKVKREFDKGDTVDVVYRITRDYYKGNETPQFLVRDLRRA